MHWAGVQMVGRQFFEELKLRAEIIEEYPLPRSFT